MKVQPQMNEEEFEQNDEDIIDIDVESREAEIEEPSVPLIALEDPHQQKRLIEALLFASPEPVSLRSIQSRLPESADVGGILMELQAEFAPRGVNLVQVGEAWAFRTALDISPSLALAKKQEKRLSRAALETLSIIAYHQPVTRAEIENIRGVTTNKGTLDVLMEAGWIKPGRRLETPGRPLSWVTTNLFMDEFGIANMNDLPGLQEMKAAGLLDTRPAIETIPGAADLFSVANREGGGFSPTSAEDENNEYDDEDEDDDQYQDEEDR
jgi:segregation and condensation protein B